jgi:hypothetical protein
MFDQHRAYSRNEWAFYFSPNASRFTVEDTLCSMLFALCFFGDTRHACLPVGRDTFFKGSRLLIFWLHTIHDSRFTTHDINGMGFFVFLMFNASRFTELN